MILLASSNAGCAAARRARCRTAGAIERAAAEASGRDELFLVKNTEHGAIVPVTQMHIGFRINAFADYIGVPLHEGRRWQLARTSSARRSRGSSRGGTAPSCSGSPNTSSTHPSR